METIEAISNLCINHLTIELNDHLLNIYVHCGQQY